MLHICDGGNQRLRIQVAASDTERTERLRYAAVTTV